MLGSLFKDNMDATIDEIHHMLDELKSVTVTDIETLKEVADNLERRVMSMCNDIRLETFNPDNY